jgi:hypothetical protein
MSKFRKKPGGSPEMAEEQAVFLQASGMTRGCAGEALK